LAQQEELAMKQERYVDTAALEALASLLFIEARNICVGCRDSVILNMGDDHGLRGGPTAPFDCRAKKLRKLTKSLYGIIDEYKKANDKEHEFWKPKGAKR
jgi:hypothetical protein